MISEEIEVYQFAQIHITRRKIWRKSLKTYQGSDTYLSSHIFFHFVMLFSIRYVVF